MGISFLGIFFVGVILSLVLVPLVASLMKAPHWANLGVFFVTGSLLVLLFLASIVLIRSQKFAGQDASTVQQTLERSPSIETSSPYVFPVVERFYPVWRKIIFLGLILAVPIALGLRFAHRQRLHTHFARHGLFALPLVLIVLGLFAFWTVAPTSLQPSPPMVATSQSVRHADHRSIASDQEQGSIPIHGLSETHTSKVTAEKEIDSAATASSDHASPPAESAASDKPVDENLPAWIRNPELQKDDAGATPRPRGDDVRYRLVHIDGNFDSNIRDDLMNAKLKEVTNLYIDDTLFNQRGVSSIVNVSAEYLRDHCNGGEYVSRSTGDSYFRLKFDFNFRHMVQQQYNASIAQDHLQQLGAAGAVAFAALGGLYMFLRATPSGGKLANADATISGSAT